MDDARHCDSTGQPTAWLGLPDGMTKISSQTPLEKGSVAKGNKPVPNRVFCVKVVCEPVEGWLLYHTDNMVRGGANFYLTIIKEALEDLTKLLHEKSFELLKKGTLQADNCGEGKGKYTNMLASLLIEQGYMDVITASYLTFGHTHCIVDQYFFTLRAKHQGNNGVCWVGSPLSLHKLYSLPSETSQQTSHKATKQSRPFTPPLVNPQFWVM